MTERVDYAAIRFDDSKRVAINASRFGKYKVARKHDVEQGNALTSVHPCTVHGAPDHLFTGPPP